MTEGWPRPESNSVRARSLLERALADMAPAERQVLLAQAIQESCRDGISDEAYQLLVEVLTREQRRRIAGPRRPTPPPQPIHQPAGNSTGGTHRPEATQLNAHYEQLKQAIAEIDRSVIVRGVFGKIPYGTIMHGEPRGPRVAGADYDGYPPEMNLFHQQERRGYRDKLDLFFNAARENPAPLRALQKKHFLTRVAAPDGLNQLVDYAFWQAGVDRGNRPLGYVHARFILPPALAQRLERLVREDPDAAEWFYLTAAAGLEQGDPAQPGIHRVASDELVMVDLDALIPDQFYAKAANHYLLANSWSRMQLEEFDRAVGRFPYSRPYGTVAPPDALGQRQ